MTEPRSPQTDPELERWNTRFSAREYVFGKEPNAFLAAQASRLRPGMRALCVADGEGRNSVWLARLGLQVTAFDFSPVGLDKARALDEEARVAVHRHHVDVENWRWEPGMFDVVAAIFVQFAGPALRARMFEGMKRTLAPGGWLIVQGYRPEQLGYGTGGPKQLENFYTEALLRDAFSDLEIVHLVSHDDWVDEGPGHRGMSALIDLVAHERSGPPS